jgi:hypothetical protein
VEWLERAPDGAVRWARVECAEVGAKALLAAVLEARRTAGASARALVLAVGAPHSFQRVLALPPLADKDLELVLARRARALSGTPDDTVRYRARALARIADESDGDAPQTSWLVAGTRPEVGELRRELREHGLRARRVVSAELAALECGRRHAQEPTQPVLQIVVSDGAVAVALTSGADLHYHQTIEGDLTTRPALASGLVHEIRTCAAFWKKASRGQNVSQVVVLGLARERVELLALTLAGILPGASVTPVVAGDDERGARLALVAAAHARGALSPELTAWLPPHRRRVGLVLTLVGVLALASASLVLDRALIRAGRLADEAQALRRGTAELEELRARGDELASVLADVRRHAVRGAELASHGLELESLLASLGSSFDGRAELEQLRLGLGDEGPELTLRGRCAGDSAALVARLGGLLERLAREPALPALALSLPEELARAPGATTVFTLTSGDGG